MPTQTKVFVATSSFTELTKSVLKISKKKNIIFKTNPLKKKLTSKQLVKYANDCDYIIAGTEIYDKNTLNRLKKLKLLFRLGSGVDNIDIDYLKKKKIKFKRSKITPEIAVAELVVGYVFSIYRKIIEHNNNLKNKVWKKQMGSILYGKTFGIVGFGKVGKYLYKILKNFGVELLVHDKKEINVKNTDINKLIKKSDIISININLSSKKKLFDKQKLKLCKKNCVIINTSRPEVLDYDYLYIMLKTKKILGAGLDVFMNEPYSGKFVNLKNTVLTPHIGGYSKEIRSKMEKESIDFILNNNA